MWDIPETTYPIAKKYASMWEYSETTYPIAKKSYHCEAFDWIDNSGLSQNDFSKEDYKTIKKAQREGNQIKEGTRYINTRGKFDGEFCTCRMRIDLHEICIKYELYEQ